MATAVPMEPERAARLIEKWINFYGMENPKAWSCDHPPKASEFQLKPSGSSCFPS